MPGWTEQTLRAAASWQAFKEGSDLRRMGAVIHAAAEEAGWQGQVLVGKRPLRVRVVVRSATDFQVACPCPENRRSGAVCAHAVATGLAALVPKDAREGQGTVVEPFSAVAWELDLPGAWRQALSKGRLSARVCPVAGLAPGPADLALTGWLESQGLRGDRVHTLVLGAGTLAGFLRVLTGHERLRVEGGGAFLRVSQGARFRVGRVEREGGRTTLVPEAGPCEWLVEGRMFGRISETACELAGGEEVPDSFYAGLRRLAAGQVLVLSDREFLRDANEWREWVEWPPDCWVERLKVRPAACRVRVSLDGSSRQLRALVTASYEGAGDCAPAAGILSAFPWLEGDVCCRQDFEKEEETVRRMSGYGFLRSEGDPCLWTLTGEESVADFLAGARSRLRREWEWEESAAVRRLAEDAVMVAPNIEIRGSGEDWLSFSVGYRTEDGEVLEAGEARRLLRGGRVQTRSGKVCRMAGGEARAWESLLADLDASPEGDGYRVNARAGLAVDEVRRRMEGGNSAELPCVPLPTGFQGSLREYQAQGVSWLRDRTRRFGGAILADDMGLGKTVQTIAWVESVCAEEPAARVLVLATTSLLGNWQEEWARFAPGRLVRVLHGAARDRSRDEAGGGEVWLTSHATMVRDLAWYLRQEFAILVVDEASVLRNPDTDQAKAVRKLKARCKVALTGTPVENSVRDLWSIFSWVQPGWLGSRVEFREGYEDVMKSDGVEKEVALARLRLKTAPFILRRTKQRVAPELPSKIVLNEFCDMGAAQAKLYAELAREGRRLADTAAVEGTKGTARMVVLTTLLRLRQVCCDPALLNLDCFKQKNEKIDSIKHQRLIELLDQSFEVGSKVLVFSQFRNQLLEIERKVKERGWRSLRLDGQSRNRMELVKQFQSEDGPPLFLVSLKAGGYGLNLTAADVVIHMDPWWNPAVEEQANDRAHRIGQSKPVTVVRLLTRGTVEEAVLRLQERKRTMAAVVEESGLEEPVGWTMEDLSGLLR